MARHIFFKPEGTDKWTDLGDEPFRKGVQSDEDAILVVKQIARLMGVTEGMQIEIREV